MPSPHEQPLPPPVDPYDRVSEVLAQHVLRDTAGRLGAMGVAHGLETSDASGRERQLPPGAMHRVGLIDFGGGLTREALLPGLGGLHVALPGDEASRGRSVAAARTLALAMLESRPPGCVRLSVYNKWLTNDFAGFDGLGDLFEAVPPNGLQGFLERLENRQAGLAVRDRPAGTPSEPWQIAIIMDNGTMSEPQRQQLDTLVAAGTGYGSLITIGVPLSRNDKWLFDSWHIDQVLPGAVRYDPPLPRQQVRGRCEHIANEARAGTRSPELRSVVSAETWQASSRDGLAVPLGIDVETGRAYEIRLGNQDTVHGMLTGRTGSGKSNVLNALITSMTQKYSPGEVQLMLLDYKMGVEFARYAREPYLPHATLVGEKIDDDPEFGIAALQHLKKELDRRGARLHELGATTYTELHDDPEHTWPRIVLVMDEFHKLLMSDLGDEAADLLLYVAKQGRSMGVHLLLATQNLEGIDALATKNKALFGNIALRIATAQGTMLNPLNTAAEFLPRHHALVNHASGDQSKNVILWVPDASSPPDGKDAVAAYQRSAYRRYLDVCQRSGRAPAPPGTFNGGLVPSLETARDFRRLRSGAAERTRHTAPRALLAQKPSVADKSAGVALSRDSGSNIAVIGPPARRQEANSVLHAAALSLAVQQPPELARFSLVGLDTQSAAALEQTAGRLRQHGHDDVRIIANHQAPGFLAETHGGLDLHAERNHFVIVYGGDASQAIMNAPITTDHVFDIGDGKVAADDGSQVHAHISTLLRHADGGTLKSPVEGTVRLRGGQLVVVERGKSGLQLLSGLLADGPGCGTHVIASFSSPDGLKQAIDPRLGLGRNGSVIGSWVAIGVQPHELGGFTPDNPYVGPVSGIERPNRALFYDRSGRPPYTVRLYAGPSLPDEDDD